MKHSAWLICGVMAASIGVAVAAEEASTTVTKGRTESGTIQLKSRTDSTGRTITRGTINGRAVRYTSKTTTAKTRQPVKVGRECLSCKKKG